MFSKIVIFPAQMAKGKIVVNDFAPPPYGYHHVLGIYPDGSSWQLATIDVSIDPAKVAKCAEHLANNVPVEIDPEYYRKEWHKNHPEQRYKFLD